VREAGAVHPLGLSHRHPLRARLCTRSRVLGHRQLRAWHGHPRPRRAAV